MTAHCFDVLFYLLQPIKDGELPPFDAMESVLPEYQYIFVDPNQPRREPPNPALQETQPLPR